MPTFDEVLRHREARGIRYMSLARIGFSAVGIATSYMERAAGYDMSVLNLLWLGTIIINTGFVWYLKKEKHLDVVGMTGVAMDVLFLSLLPVIWYQWVGGSVVSAAFLVKFPLAIMCFLTISISSLAMKPQYPAAATTGILFIHLVLLFMALDDPRLRFSVDFAEVFLGAAVNMDFYILVLVLIAMSGGTVTFLTFIARKAVHDAVRLERENTEMQERQNQLIVQGKMDSLKSLVAGFAHEVNTPIGAVNSGADLAERCAHKITEVIDTSETLNEIKTSPPLQKSLRTLHTSSTATKTAGERIHTIISSLRSFARLDEAEFQIVDLYEGLESALTLIEHQLRDRITVVKEYGDLPQIACSPAELNQVFMNVLTNAIQAIEGEGRITIRTDADHQGVSIDITDTGRGISPEQLENIFEPGFTKASTRVKAGLGLFTSYNIIRSHQGDLKIESLEGEGTTVSIVLPLGAG